MIISVFTGALAGALTYGVIQAVRGNRLSLSDWIVRGIVVVPRVVIVAVLASVLISIGGAALVIPGLIIAVYLWVIIPVAVVERPGLFGSFSRSAQLVRGNWWRVLGLVLIVSVPYIIAYVAVSEAIPSTEDLRVSGLVAQWIVLVLWAPFVCVTYVVCYHDLRAAQEAVEIEQPAQHSAVKSGRQKVIWIFYSVVGIVIGLIIVGAYFPTPESNVPTTWTAMRGNTWRNTIFCNPGKIWSLTTT